jgi:hypothetical protein
MTYLAFAFVCFCADLRVQTRIFDILEVRERLKKREPKQNQRLTRPVHCVESVAVTIIEFDRRFTNCSSVSLGLLLVSGT